MKSLTLSLHSWQAENESIDTLFLRMDPNDFSRLNDLRKKALKENKYDQAKVYFKGKIRQANSEKVKVKFKMKGDQYDHYNSDRFSLRVSSRKNEEDFGTVSIQHPKVRGYLNEWIFHQMLKQENLPHLRYEFSGMQINEVYKGTYACEQYFSDPDVFKNWQGKTGPIIGFRDDLFWTHSPPEERDNKYDTDRYREAEIKIFNAKICDSLLVKQALQKMKRYQADSCEAYHLFDLEKLGQFYALMDLMGGRHALRWINVRYYFNPDTELFEPLGYDSNNGRTDKLMVNSSYIKRALHKNIMDEKDFKYAYYEFQTRYASQAFLDDFFSNVEEEMNVALHRIYLSNPEYNFDTQQYYNNQQIIRIYLETAN